MEKKMCVIEDCNEVVKARSLCCLHYNKLYHAKALKVDKHRFIPNEIRQDGDTIYLRTTDNKELIIDTEDYDKVRGFRWHLDHDYGRAMKTVDSKITYYKIHRVIMNAPDDKQIDHIDGNPLNNKKSNLRLCTAAENARNCKVSKNNKLGVKGVSWDSEKKRYLAQICVDKKRIFLGRYDTVEEASNAYQKASLTYHKDYSRMKSR